MIVPRKACKCALCSHEWLPTKSKNNRDADPRKVARCASCKSTYWNSDDPKVIAEQEAKKAGGYHAALAGIEALSGLQPGSVIVEAATPNAGFRCRHRVLLQHCPLCHPSMAVNA